MGIYTVYVGASIMGHVSSLLSDLLKTTGIDGEIIAFPGAHYGDQRVLKAISDLVKGPKTKGFETILFIMVLCGNAMFPCRRVKIGNRIHAHPSKKPANSVENCLQFSKLITQIRKIGEGKPIRFIYVSSPPPSTRKYLL